MRAMNCRASVSDAEPMRGAEFEKRKADKRKADKHVVMQLILLTATNFFLIEAANEKQIPPLTDRKEVERKAGNFTQNNSCLFT